MLLAPVSKRFRLHMTCFFPGLHRVRPKLVARFTQASTKFDMEGVEGVHGDDSTLGALLYMYVWQVQI